MLNAIKTDMKKRTPAQRQKMREIAKAKKYGKWMLGKKLSNITIEKMRIRMIGKNNPLWKENPTYSALHSWVIRNYGDSKYCEDCGTTTASRYEWANITGIYNRERKNWKRLCRKCHTRFDDIINKGWKTRKRGDR